MSGAIMQGITPQENSFMTDLRSKSSSRMNLGSWLVVLSAVFNFILCFINTRGWIYVNASLIAVVELAIMLAGFMVIRHDISRKVAVIGALSIAYMIGAKLINPALSLKIIHDFAIACIFWQIGYKTNIFQVNKCLHAIISITIVFAIFEFLAPIQFGDVFNVWQYYVQKGVLSSDTVNYSGTNLYLSGNRGSASRLYFPQIFGGHRISSVFLEPDSVGNLAAILFGWCLATYKNSPGNRKIGLFLIVALLIVLSDSRFATGCCLVMLILRVTPFARSALIAFLIPVCVMVLLTVVGSMNEISGWLPSITSDDFSGRLLFSGRVLDYWDVSHWMALAVSPVYTADTGYAYISNNLGIIFALVYLISFSFTPMPNRVAGIMRMCVAVYFATSLCVGASVFTIKTAALLWFLYGASFRLSPSEKNS
ncbi:polysaccharide polymerase [Acetobacter sp. UBA5411]|uniref:polysaccharide polymerase n=1 Tax=Acetobacter sp. UBA5411 TaxID=1945905 RepID=UPI0025C64740|nr:polysaccharide polymerase [Acetobacter sp. UBA5411]